MDVAARSRRFFVTAIGAAAGLVFLVAPAGASAAFGFGDDLQAAPTNTQAGANSDFELHLSFTDPDEQLKDLTVHLPPGLVGNPTATPLCAGAEFDAGNCNPASQVGIATTGVDVHILSLPLTIPLTANGTVYNLAPHPGEPARLGIQLNAVPFPIPLLGNAVLPPIRIQSPASLRQSDFGLDTTINDIPNEATVLSGLTAPIDVTEMTLTLFGSAGNPPKPFLRNPTSCGLKTTKFDADSYANPNTTVHGEASFTSTNCAALPFSPGFSARLGAPGETGPNTKTPATTVISQTEAEAGLRRAKVLIPDNLGNNAALLNNACPVANFEAGTCPDNSIIGSARATSPLLPQELAGPVAFVHNPVGIPNVGLDLRGPLALKLQGSTLVGPTGIEFDGLPDIPISEFELHFNGEPDGLLIAETDLCEPPAAVFRTDFTGHNGAHASGDVRAIIDGCGSKGEPTVKLKLKKKRSRRPRMKLDARAGINAITRMQMKLPKPLRFAGGKKWKRGARGSDDGGKLAKSELRHSKRKLKLSDADGNGTEKFSARIRKGALRRIEAYKKKRLKFPTTLVDTSGHTTSLKLKVKVRRR